MFLLANISGFALLKNSFGLELYKPQEAKALYELKFIKDIISNGAKYIYNLIVLGLFLEKGIYDKDFSVEVVWPNKERYIVKYPSNQMAAERETCEITSIKNIKLLEELYIKQKKKYHPKEWVYTHDLIYTNKKSFSIEKLITKLDSIYTKKEIEKSLLNISPPMII